MGIHDYIDKNGGYMNYSGMNMEQVKRQNRGAILSYIVESGPVSRKEIAETTGLTPAAVTQICNSLLEEKILMELGTAQSQGVGRKKVLVDIDYDHIYIYAINIEPESVVIAVSNLKGDAKAETSFKLVGGEAPTVVLREIAKMAKEMAKEQGDLPLCGVSVAISGIVDKAEGVSVHAYGIWDEKVDVASVLEEEFQLPVIVENNVNALAYAEKLFGFGKEYENLMLIKWGPGVGSSLILHKELYEGTDRKAAELGHYIVEKDGAKCSCGRRGCLETKVSYHALSKICKFTPDTFGDALEKEEKLQDAFDLFARCIVNAITIVSPNQVILCGSLFKDERVRKGLMEKCKYYDASIDESRILYTGFEDKENYIGPVAAYLRECVLYKK